MASVLLRTNRTIVDPRQLHPLYDRSSINCLRVPKFMATETEPLSTSAPVLELARVSNLLVSPEITASRADFFGARTALSARSSVVTSDSRTRLSALLWLRQRRAALCRRFPIGSLFAARGRYRVRGVCRLEALRYGRLETRATTLSTALRPSKVLDQNQFKSERSGFIVSKNPRNELHGGARPARPTKLRRNNSTRSS